MRGAVGIALALALDNEVFEVTGGDDITKFEIWTSQVYEMVGGIAFTTLVCFLQHDALFSLLKVVEFLPSLSFSYRADHQRYIGRPTAEETGPCRLFGDSRQNDRGVQNSFPTSSNR